MPKIEVDGIKTIDAEVGKKLVLAIEDGGVDISHRCGGNARCTTCRVKCSMANCRQCRRPNANGSLAKSAWLPTYAFPVRIGFPIMISRSESSCAPQDAAGTRDRDRRIRTGRHRGLNL